MAPNDGKPSSRTRSRSPAPSSRSPALNRAAPNGTPQRVAAAPTGKQRPPYHSDGDSRPVLRGWFYEVVNRSLARPLLTAYLLALGGFCYTGALMPVGLFCRLLHAAMLAANSIFSDELHNCDKRLGGAARSKGPLVAAARAATHRSIGPPACPGLPSGPERKASRVHAGERLRRHSGCHSRQCHRRLTNQAPPTSSPRASRAPRSRRRISRRGAPTRGPRGCAARAPSRRSRAPSSWSIGLLRLACASLPAIAR